MDDPGRWHRRPVLGTALGAVIVLTPVAASVVAAVICSRVVGAPRTLAGFVAAWALVLVAATAAMALTERQVRKLLPLRALLNLSLVFPDRAPSRFRVALRSGSVARLKRAVDSRDLAREEPTEAAATILALAGALNAHDPRTRGHSERVRALTDMLADELRLDPVATDRLRWAALLHDVGKITVPAEVLNKTGELTEDDWAAVHRHPVEGARLAAPLKPWLAEWADTIEQHHERWDGTGYPNGLAGAHISYGSRIVAVADAFEVMTHARSYKDAVSPSEARAELARCAGTHFDPAVVRAFLRISLGRLRWLTGPLAWAADLGLVGAITRLPVPAPLAGAARTAATLTTAGALALPIVAAPVAPSIAPSPTHDVPSTAVLGEVYERPQVDPYGTFVVELAAVESPSTTTAPRRRRPPAPSKRSVAAAGQMAWTPGVPPAVRSAWGAVGDIAVTTARKPVRIDVLANDVGDFDPKTLRLVGEDPPVSLANVNAHGEIVFVPGPGAAPVETFGYEVCESAGACSTATVTVTLE